MTETFVDHAYFVSHDDNTVTFDVIGVNGGLNETTLRLSDYPGDSSNFDVPVGTEACIRYVAEDREYYLSGVDFDCNELMHRKVHRLQQDNLETQKKLKKLEKRFYNLEKYYIRNINKLNERFAAEDKLNNLPYGDQD